MFSTEYRSPSFTKSSYKRFDAKNGTLFTTLIVPVYTPQTQQTSPRHSFVLSSYLDFLSLSLSLDSKSKQLRRENAVISPNLALLLFYVSRTAEKEFPASTRYYNLEMPRHLKWLTS